MTALVAIVTVLVLLFYFWTALTVGRMRGKHKIDAPAMTGHPEFERAVRVQMNTLEWIVIFLPAMWLCAAYVNPMLAAALGVVWIVGRYMYMQGYLKDPKARSMGFMIQMGATAVALFGGLIGAVVSIFTGGGGA
jgi:glutathione S-transferase